MSLEVAEATLEGLAGLLHDKLSDPYGVKSSTRKKVSTAINEEDKKYLQIDKYLHIYIYILDVRMRLKLKSLDCNFWV